MKLMVNTYHVSENFNDSPTQVMIKKGSQIVGVGTEDGKQPCIWVMEGEGEKDVPFEWEQVGVLVCRTYAYHTIPDGQVLSYLGSVVLDAPDFAVEGSPKEIRHLFSVKQPAIKPSMEDFFE